MLLVKMVQIPKQPKIYRLSNKFSISGVYLLDNLSLVDYNKCVKCKYRFESYPPNDKGCE